MNIGLDGLLKEYDGILITSAHNMRYFSGFSGGEGAVWISGEERLILTDSRYIEQAKNETKGFEVVETNDWIYELCSIIKNKNALFEDKSISAARYFDIKEKTGVLKLFPGSDIFSRMRMIKTEKELEVILRAEQICCRAFERILRFIKPGISEKQLAAELEYYVRQEGGDKMSFETIAVSGKRTSLPHGVPSDKRIEKGDFVTLDFGCVLDGYSSDMTRTVVVGKASDEQKKIYNAVKDAQQAGLDFIREGVLAKDADRASRKIIEDSGYGDYFRHSLGHGVGLLVHELPNLSPKSEFILKENMVLTCEPGIYIPDFGGVRIEDMVCVKKDGNLNLTYVEKELIEL